MFKKLFFILLFLSSLGLRKASAQAAPFAITLNCSNNRITAINIPQVNSPTPLWTGAFTFEDPCNRVFVYPTYCGNGSNQPRFFLDRFNFDTKTWLQWAGPVGCPVFDVQHATWRVRMQNPIEVNGSGCEGGHVRIYNDNDQWIGWLGTYENAPMITSSNVVVAGPTTQNEVAAKYKETYGIIGNARFNYDEIPKLNTFNTKNYDRWWIAIYERGGQNRFGGLGWTFGFIPNDEINLSAVWSAVTNGGTFAPVTSGVTYEVQFAVAGQCNQFWVQASLPFFGVCIEGMPCREVFMEPDISLNPNPANTAFRLSGLDLNTSNPDQRLTIYDLSGRIVKEFLQVNQEDFNISDLPIGLYVVSLWEGERRIKTLKLSIVR